MLVKRIIVPLFCLLGMISCGKSLNNLEGQKSSLSKNKLSTNSVVNKPKNTQKNPSFSFPKGDFILGDKNAPMSVVIFVDYYCASCARANRVLMALLNDVELKTSVNVSFRQYPVRRLSIKPAEVALAAGLQGNDKFWQMSEKLFAADGDLDEKNYLPWAREIGLDTNKFARDLLEKNQELLKAINRDRAIAASVKKAGSTPGIFVDGHLFNAPVTLENLKKFVRIVEEHKKKKGVAASVKGA